MIKLIEKCLKSFEQVSDWRIEAITSQSEQAFFVKGKLETNRLVETMKYYVTVYVRDNGTIGQSSFLVSHKISSSELKKQITEAIAAASYVHNQDYSLVEGNEKKNFKAKGFEVDAKTIFAEISAAYNSVSTPNCKFNAVEIFVNNDTYQILNSKGVNYKKTTNELQIEAIPSYDGKEKVELYKFFEYTKYDINKIKEDAIKALEDVKVRYEATKLENVKSIDVILRSEDIKGFIGNFVYDYSYQAVYSHSSPKNIGESVQGENPLNKLTVSLDKESKCDAFDADGVLLKEVKVIEDGILINNFGPNQYAKYLNATPTGYLSCVKIKPGKKDYKTLTKEPYLEIVALSGIQVETDSDYIGGEVRLALYYDGEKVTPVSGFSFSGSIKMALDNMEFSKEKEDIKNYNGPKYLKIKNMQIMA